MRTPRRYLFPALLLIAAIAWHLVPHEATPPRLGDALRDGDERGRGPGSREVEAGPDDWFLAQRAYPFGTVDNAAYLAAMHRATSGQALNKAAGSGAWELIGPTNIGGRITALAVVPGARTTYYAGTAHGGVFRTRDRGLTWAPLSDDQTPLPIGDVAIDPRDSNVIYAGTGEPNGGHSSYGGDGVYRSTDGGATWANIGLKGSSTIGRVLVDPSNSNRVFVAAMGDLYRPGQERGLYLSTDRGATWQGALTLGDSTGCIDVIVDSTMPSIIYALMWQRVASPGVSVYGGRESGVYRSTDAGATWAKMAGGLPTGSVGRIALAFAPSLPTRVYATFTDATGSFTNLYRSNDRGLTWKAVDEAHYTGLINCNDYGWWFGQIRVSPADPNVIYMLGVSLARSDDAGRDWLYMDEDLHPDNHALLIDPAAPSSIVVGNDGGVYFSENAGAKWWKSPSMPLTQAYHCTVDPSNPLRVYCGTQDNRTLRTITGSLNDWSIILEGDGFEVQVDPTNSAVIYAESQHGNLHRSVNDGALMTPIRPVGDGQDRSNWNTPFVLDPQEPSRLYFGANRLYVSLNRGDAWYATSDDLTRGGIGTHYGTITTIAVAPSDTRVIYVGTDDGLAWVSLDRGAHWGRITAGLPNRWVTRIVADPLDASIAYITLSGFGNGTYQPHVLRTTNNGTTWTDISGNLPEVPANDLMVDPANGARLYVATDLGVYTTAYPNTDRWRPVAAGLPKVAVMDLALHGPTRRLYAGTFGRSLYAYNLDNLDEVAGRGAAADRISLASVGPNPFNASARMRWEVPAGAGAATIEIFDLSGDVVRRFAGDALVGTSGTLAWDGRAADGGRLPAGAYLARLRAGSASAVVMLVLNR